MKKRNKTKKWTVEQLDRMREQHVLKHAKDFEKTIGADQYYDVIEAHSRLIDRRCREPEHYKNMRAFCVGLKKWQGGRCLSVR